MACKYIFNNTTYSSKEEFIKKVLEKDFLNQPKTLRVQELQQPDFLKFIRKDKNYLKSQGLTDQEVNFLNLLFGEDEKWTSFFIKSLIQNAAKDGYSKVWLPSGNTSAKVEGHATLEEFKKQKEDRIKLLENKLINIEKNPEQFIEEVRWSVADIEMSPLEVQEIKVDYEITKISKEISQLKQELERVEAEGFGALRPIFKFYEENVTNILNKTYGKDKVNQITDEYGNTWNEVDLSIINAKQKILLQKQSLLNQFHKRYFDYVATLPQELDNVETTSENIPDALEKIKMLQKVFPDAIVIMDENMDELGVVLGKDHGMKEHEGKIVIKVNPNKFSKDTIIHEFAHILIDTYDQQVIKNTIDKLRGTDLWEEVASLYPELDDESLGKEVLATAIGMEGADLFDRLKDPSLFERIKSIIDKILLRASRLLGINPYTARRLAKELLYDMVSSNLTDYETVQDQYSKQGVTYDKLKDRLDRFRTSIKLNEDTHEYTVTKKDGTVVPSHEITSGTTYVKEVLPELDFTDDDIDAVVIKRIVGLDAFKARFTYDGKKSVFKKDDFYNELKKFKVEHPDFDNVKSKLVDDWNAKAKLGTEAHAYLNNLIEEKPTSTDNLTPEMVKTLDDIYKSLKAALREGSIMYSELPIYYSDNKGKKIAGTIDLLILHKDGTVDIIDYKTFGSDNMANDIAYANYVKYKGIAHTAQLTLYKTLLEQYGYKVDKLKTIIIKRGYDENGNINSLTRLPKLFNAFTLHTTFYKNNQLYTYNKIQTIINNSLK